jgi:predicted DNA-binding transcriptional regulator AlpA
MLPCESLLLTESAVDNLADALWARIVGSNCDPIELNLRAKLALEHRLLGGSAPPFGLDKLGTEETAAYTGVKAETLRDKTKRRILGIPQPYNYGRKLFWRRSELDQWIERQRVTAAEVG